MSAARKTEAKRSAWITAATVFLVFQAAGAAGSVFSGLYSWVTGYFQSGYGLSDFALYFIPPFITTVLFAGAPLFLLHRVVKNTARASTLGYLLIAEFVALFILWVVLIRLVTNVPFPYPSAGLQGFYGQFEFLLGIPVFEAWGYTFFDIATLTNIAYLVIGIGLLTIAPVKKPGALAPIATTSSSKGSRAKYKGEWYTVQIPFYDEKKLTFFELQDLAKQKLIQPATAVRIGKGKGKTYPAQMIPGLFSDKSMTTAVVLGLLVGQFGIDRFYLGYTGLGILKLLTLGGCGIWALIDVVLVALRKVPDSSGRPLR
jgi:TM2 domain-containing membrane protein YozV